MMADATATPGALYDWLVGWGGVTSCGLAGNGAANPLGSHAALQAMTERALLFLPTRFHISQDPSRAVCLHPVPSVFVPLVAGKPAAGDVHAVAARGAGVAGSAMRMLDMFGCSINYNRR
jgi:hypothetical protein